MKLKIRVKKTDFLLFILVCIALFVCCSILSINFISLSNDGELVGFNIFTHMNGSSLGLTIFLFIVSLVFIFVSVSSTIFDFEKGKPGLTFGEKDEKGYNRWTTTKEMKNAWNIKPVKVDAPVSDAGGIVLINDGKKMWVDDGEYHTLIIGQSGSGKTSALVDPQVFSLCKHGESMVITDPKGEIYRNHANRLKANGYRIIVINLRDPKEGNAWNPLTIPYRMYKQGKTDKAKELLEDISQNILIDPKNTNDPFWEKSAADYFSALALGLFQDAKENEVNISSISNMATLGEEKNGISTYAKDYFNLKGETSSAYEFGKSTFTAPAETKSSILSVFQSKIRIFSSREELSEMLSYSDFNMEDIGKEKTAVFIVVHDEKKTYHPLATIFIKQLYEVLIDVAHKNPDGKLKYRTNFILDEFANMPALKDVDAMVTAARSRRIRFTFIIQNFAQLDEVYNEKKAETIRSNCGNTIYLLTNELSALEEISKLCGEVKSKEKDKTVSTPLVTVTDLQKMKMNEIIVIRMRMRPFRTTLKASYEIDWGDHYDEAVFSEREVYPVKLFDIKQFVKEEKKRKTMEALNKMENEESHNPFIKDNIDEEPFNFGSDILPSPSSNDGSDSFDIDKLIKNIDAQIAALEKEQAEENKKKLEEQTKMQEQKEEIKIPAVKVSTENKPSTPVEVDVGTSLVDSQIVTDDQYFDDFFGDDDY